MWFQHCDNPQAIAELYASGDGLDHVRLYEAVLLPDGHLQLRMGLARFPDHPRPRWEPQATAVQATVNFWFVEDLRLEGWTGDTPGVLSVLRTGDRLRLAFASESMRIEARCRSARIDRVSPYAVWAEEGPT